MQQAGWIVDRSYIKNCYLLLFHRADNPAWQQCFGEKCSCKRIHLQRIWLPREMMQPALLIAFDA